MRERKLVRVLIVFPLLLEWLTQDNKIKGILETTQGLPSDALFISSYYDEKKMQAVLIFEHESFAPISYGEEIPYLEILFTQYQAEVIDNAMV